MDWASAGGETYCGPAPTAAEIWQRWNFDPALLLAFGLAVLGFLALRPPAEARLPFAAAMGVLVVAFVSPLCALTVALFSARAGHHLLLISAAAPLFAMALRPRLPADPMPVAALVAASTVILWVWHLPAIYTWALADVGAYWLMQGSLLGSATLLWGAVLRARLGTAIGALLASAVQMGLLGALLTFAGRPLYTPHFTASLAFGLDPLHDQQLAGLLMWVPGGLPYLLAATLMVSQRISAAAADERR